MSGIPHDHYEPKSGWEKGLAKRLPIVGLIYDTIMIPTPKNLNWMWIWGIVLTFTLMLQIITGIILVMHYTPHVDMAFASVEHIMRNVNGGWALRYIHQNGASLFFIAVYMHIFRGLYYGSYKAPREITWIIGMLIYVLMMGTAFMGYVLPWGQMSFWGATVITGLFGTIPFVGEAIQTWLLGGPSVDNATLNRFLSLHYLLPFVILGMVVLHIWAFHTTGNNNPTGVEVRRTSKKEAEADTLPFWPYFVIKDLFALAVILAVFFAIVGFMPNFLGHPDNYIEANPLVTPAHIVPEWYFLPFYAVLRAFDGDVWVVIAASFLTGGIVDAAFFGVVAMFGAIVVMALAPWLDTSSVRSGRYRPMFKWWFWLFIVNFFILMWVGARPAEGIYPYIALIGTTYWFAYFLVILPFWVSSKSRCPRPRPSKRTSKSTTANPMTARAAPPHLRRHRPSDRKGRHEHVQKTCHQCSHGRRGRPPLGGGARSGRRRLRRGLQLLVRGSLRPVRPEPAAARPAGLHRGLLGLPRPAIRALAHTCGRGWPRADR
jgi:ubiquinol-cytochrome c reductase cytochrome b subunit